MELPSKVTSHSCLYESMSREASYCSTSEKLNTHKLMRNRTELFVCLILLAYLCDFPISSPRCHYNQLNCRQVSLLFTSLATSPAYLPFFIWQNSLPPGFDVQFSKKYVEHILFGRTVYHWTLMFIFSFLFFCLQVSYMASL